MPNIPLGEFDRFGLGAVCASLLWILWQIISRLLGIYKGKPNGGNLGNLINDSRKLLSDALSNINQQFEHYTQTITKHDSILTTYEGRIKHLEGTVVELMKERRCSVHGDLVGFIAEIRTDIKELKDLDGKVEGIVKTLETMQNMGALHTHQKAEK